MENNDLGTRGSLFLIIFLAFGFISTSKQAFSQDRTIEKILLYFIPYIIGISTWLILLLGPAFAVLDLISILYKVPVIISYTYYLFKLICKQPIYEYSTLQHQLILSTSTRIFGYDYSFDSCKKVNKFIKILICVIIIGSFASFFKAGVLVKKALNKEEYGVWDWDIWGLARCIEVFGSGLGFWGLMSLHNVAVKSENDRFLISFLCISFQSLHPIISYIISLSHTANSNTFIILLSSTFGLIESILLTYYSLTLSISKQL